MHSFNRSRSKSTKDFIRSVGYSKRQINAGTNVEAYKRIAANRHGQIFTLHGKVESKFLNNTLFIFSLFHIIDGAGNFTWHGGIIPGRIYYLGIRPYD